MKKDNPLWDFARYLVKVYKSEKAESRAGDAQKEANEKELKAKELELIKSSNKVNRMLSALTLAAVCISGYQAYLSKVSIDAANHALTHQKSVYTADSIQRVNDRIKQELSDAQDDSATKQNQTLQRLSVNAQIDALNAAKDQFNRKHENFIEVRDLILRFPNKDQKVELDFTVANFGMPIMLKKCRFSHSIGAPVDSVWLKQDVQKRIKKFRFGGNPGYVSESSPRAHKAVLNLAPAASLNEIEKKPFTFYVCGEIKYISLVKKERMIMRFLAKTSVLNESQYDVEYLINEIDKSK